MKKNKGFKREQKEWEGRSCGAIMKNSSPGVGEGIGRGCEVLQK